mmetsp:Transcript_11861/g.28039  ORF Transcript_11861/g.28039 Transcript_11861/m.28039 type:complete len:296 (-) Transcript_11861:735-1622(-)
MGRDCRRIMPVCGRVGCAPRRRRDVVEVPATRREQLEGRGLQPSHLRVSPALHTGVLCALLLPHSNGCEHCPGAGCCHCDRNRGLVCGHHQLRRRGEGALRRRGVRGTRQTPRAVCNREGVLRLSRGPMGGDTTGIARTDGCYVAAPARTRGRRVHRGWHTLHMPVHFGRRFGWPLPRARGPPRGPAVAPGRACHLQSTQVGNRLRNALKKRTTQRARAHRLDQAYHPLATRERGDGRRAQGVARAASRIRDAARARPARARTGGRAHLCAPGCERADAARARPNGTLRERGCNC